MPIDYGYGVKLVSLVRDEDLQNMFNWRNEARVYNTCRQVGLLSMSNHEAWFESVSRMDRDHMYAILDNEGEIIGYGGITYIDHVHGKGELSLYVGPSASDRETKSGGWGKPIIKTLTEYAFKHLRLNRVFGETFYDNVHEIANLKECGYIHEGTLRQTYWKNGKWVDSVIQSILFDEWSQAKWG